MSMVKPLDEETATFFAKKSITHVFAGHVPMGAFPKIFVTPVQDDVYPTSITSINMDLTYAHPVSVNRGACKPGKGGEQRCITSVSSLVRFRAGSASLTGKILGVTKDGKAQLLTYAASDRSIETKPESFDMVKDWAGPGQGVGTGFDRSTLTEPGRVFFGGYRVKEDKVVQKVTDWKKLVTDLWKDFNDTNATNATLPSAVWSIIDSKFNIHVYTKPVPESVGVDEEIHEYYQANGTNVTNPQE
jgi:hypothetical protein